MSGPAATVIRRSTSTVALAATIVDATTAAAVSAQHFAPEVVSAVLVGGPVQLLVRLLPRVGEADPAADACRQPYMKQQLAQQQPRMRHASPARRTQHERTTRASLGSHSYARCAFRHIPHLQLPPICCCHAASWSCLRCAVHGIHANSTGHGTPGCGHHVVLVLHMRQSSCITSTSPATSNALSQLLASKLADKPPSVTALRPQKRMLRLQSRC